MDAVEKNSSGSQEAAENVPLEAGVEGASSPAPAETENGLSSGGGEQGEGEAPTQDEEMAKATESDEVPTQEEVATAENEAAHTHEEAPLHEEAPSDLPDPSSQEETETAAVAASSQHEESEAEKAQVQDEMEPQGETSESKSDKKDETQPQDAQEEPKSEAPTQAEDAEQSPSLPPSQTEEGGIEETTAAQDEASPSHSTHDESVEAPPTQADAPPTQADAPPTQADVQADVQAPTQTDAPPTQADVQAPTQTDAEGTAEETPVQKQNVSTEAAPECKDEEERGGGGGGGGGEPSFEQESVPPLPPGAAEPAEEQIKKSARLDDLARLEADALLPPEPSEVETASPNDAFKGDKEQFHHPLTLHWCYGYNLELPVHNISEGNRKMLFYVCVHTGVLYDCTNSKQSLLQGHNNPISCSAVSADKRWLATADSGKDCVLIIWDSFTGNPIRTIFDGKGEGTAVVAISPDSQYIATISASKLQVVSIWEWTDVSNKPLCQASLGGDYSYQKFLTFHDSDPHQLVSNSEDLVVFYHWKGSKLEFHAHPVVDKDFNRSTGKFHQSVFVPGSTLAVTGTSEGYSVVWENEGDSPHVKKGVKLIRMHDSPITVVTSTLDMVVTGDMEGRIKFFDSELKMVNWYDDMMKYGPLCSISFSCSPNVSFLKSNFTSGKSISEDPNSPYSYPAESTRAASPFIVPDFTISTTSASIIYFTTNSSTPEVIVSEHDASVTALTTHPFLPRLITGGYACKVKLWDYDKKVVLGTRQFWEPNYIQCLCFDPKGEFLTVGFTDGTLQIVDAITLADVCQPFKYSRDAVTKIAFSHDSQFMATADLDKCVSVYTAEPGDSQKPWHFLAKYRSHFKRIEDLVFGVKLDSDVPRLLSLGSDKVLVEYDLVNSCEENLCLSSIDRIEQSAIPTAMTWYPPVTTESFLLVTNNQFKIKLHNSTTKLCRQTLLGPTFGSPLKKVLVLPAPIIYDTRGQEIRRYMAYCTKNMVGLLLLPHDGNPHNSKCLMAHPGKIADMQCSYDGRYIFTAGGEDCSVNMWATNTQALEAVSLLGGEDLQPFYAMLEGGRDGEFFAELEEYFYYAQIRSQGPNVKLERNVSTTIRIEEIPYIMRALGFYPSEQEIEDMINEVKFSKFVETGAYVTEIDLGNLIRLYVNHRPVFGLSPLQVGRAFKVLGSKKEGEGYWSVDRNMLLAQLQSKGEHFTEAELVEYLMTLLGYSDNPEVDGSYSADVMTSLEDIPEKITAPQFCEEILGLSTGTAPS